MVVRLSEFDFLEWFWVILFSLVAGPLTFFGLIIMWSYVWPTFLLIAPLALTSGLLLAGLSKWQNPLLRLLLAAIMMGTYSLSVLTILGYVIDN